MIAQVRRSTELGLIVLAAIITAGAYVLAALGRTSTSPPTWRRSSSSSSPC